MIEKLAAAGDAQAKAALATYWPRDRRHEPSFPVIPAKAGIHCDDRALPQNGFRPSPE
ncbi:hypothetical protein [Oleomonas cavernae]|uniref:hypothetical protein n=1 Tax=Oleomonas cavernae TaxID=2320859 RepID=UPI001314B0A0|nr:hypothetical protein [Oleomonas cavernae]